MLGLTRTPLAWPPCLRGHIRHFRAAPVPLSMAVWGRPPNRSWAPLRQCPMSGLLRGSTCPIVHVDDGARHEASLLRMQGGMTPSGDGVLWPVELLRVGPRAALHTIKLRLDLLARSPARTADRLQLPVLVG